MRITNVIFFILCTSVVFCQPDRLYFHHLTVEDGLSKTYNFFYHKDSKGLVWISSDGGLNCYDGHTIKRYFSESGDSTSLLGSIIMSPFFEDDKSNIWFSTDAGINHYIRETDSFTHDRCPDGKGGYFAGYYVMALDEQQNLWVIVNNHLYLYHIPSRKWHKQYELLPNVLRIFPKFDENGQPQFAFATSDQQPGIQYVVYDSGNGVVKNTVLFGQNSTREQLIVYDIFIEREDRVWLGANRGLFLYNPMNDQLKPADDPYQGKDINFITHIEPYQDSLLLIATATNGLLVFNKKEHQFTQDYRHYPTDPHSLAGNYLNNVKVIDGGIWVCVNGSGVDFAHPPKHKFSGALTYPTDTNLSAPLQVSTITEDQAGNIWVGSSRGGIAVLQKTNGEWKYYSVKDHPLLDTHINQIFIDAQDNIWVLTWGKLLRFNPENEQFEIFPTDKLFLWALQTKAGHIVLSPNTGGAYELKMNGGKVELEQISQIPSAITYFNFFETSDGLIIGKSKEQSLHIYDSNDHSKMRKVPVDFALLNGVSELNGTLWLATGSGLVELDKKTWKVRNTYTEKNGLATRSLNGILSDEKGRLWLSSGLGIIRFDPKNKEVRNYDLEDGLVAKEFNLLAYFKDRSGRFWFGSKNGVNSFVPTQIKEFQLIPKPGITNIIVNDNADSTKVECAETGVTNPMLIKKLLLPYRQNTITFHFSALEYSAPNKNKYRYRMKGIDPEGTWVESGNDNVARYANLPYGDYVFQVHATNSDGVWSEVPAEVQVTIRTPWYLTWWAILAYFLMFVGLISIYFYQYILYIRRMQHTRERIADDIHDNLGSGLASINIEAQLAMMIESNKQELLQSISKNAVDMSDKVKNVIWATRHEQNDMENIVIKMREEGQAKFSALSIDFRFEDHGDWEGCKLAGEQINHVMSIYREALNNIVKYAEATAVMVSLNNQGKFATLKIQDNGIGFDENTLDPTANGGGNGLRSMRARAKRIKAKLAIKPVPREGTTITLEFPFKIKSIIQSAFDQTTKIINRLQNIFSKKK